MFKNSLKKISCVISAIAVVVIVAVVLAGCQKEDKIESDNPILNNFFSSDTYFGFIEMFHLKESNFNISNITYQQHFGEIDADVICIPAIMKTIFILIALLVLLLHVFTMGHIIYKIVRLGIKFNTVWIWVILFVPVFGPILYFTGRKEI
jgi:hypothetical protein